MVLGKTRAADDGHRESHRLEAPMGRASFSPANLAHAKPPRSAPARDREKENQAQAADEGARRRGPSGGKLRQIHR